MNRVVIILLAALPLGCARPSSPPAARSAGVVVGEPGRVIETRRPAVASGLVYSPVPPEVEPLPQLARDIRQPGAFVGYDSVTVTNFYLRVDDRQFTDWTGRGGRWDGFSRRAVTIRMGTSTR